MEIKVVRDARRICCACSMVWFTDAVRWIITKVVALTRISSPNTRISMADIDRASDDVRVKSRNRDRWDRGLGIMTVEL